IPQKPQIFGHEQPIDEEKVARLVCRSSGSKPAAQLRWRKGNRDLKDSGTEVMEDPNGKTFTVTSRVEFRVTKEDNEVEVTCTVDHESLQNSERSTTQKLQVHCTLGCQGRILGFQGQDFGVSGAGFGVLGQRIWGSRCRIWGAGQDLGCQSPQEFLWEKEGSEAPLQLSSDSVLIFPFLNKSDSGTYVCTATSSMGSVVAKYNLDVSGPGAGRSCWPRMEPPGGAATSAPHPCRVSAPSLFSPPPAWADASPVPSTSSTYHAMIGGVVAVIVFLLLSLLIVLGHYLIRHKGTYLTHEAKGSDDAPDADTAIINAEGGQAGGDDKKEYFI
ncbi:CADM3 protein, partial [Rhagologus leucostigma]|nr:CADM3 protein [Rhagologus leucostigma]